MNGLVLSVDVNKCTLSDSFLHTNIALSRFFADFFRLREPNTNRKLTINELILQVGANKCTASFLAHQLCLK